MTIILIILGILFLAWLLCKITKNKADSFYENGYLFDLDDNSSSDDFDGGNSGGGGSSDDF